MLTSGVFMPSTIYASDISVTVEGQRVVFADQNPVIVDGRTLVPVRGVFEVLGFDVNWDDISRTVIFTRDDYVVTIVVDSGIFNTNGISYILDVPAQIIGGRTMLPIRTVLESIGYSVGWNEASRTVAISTRLATTEMATPEDDPRHIPFLYTLSSITLPNRQLTESERAEWIAEYWEMGGASAFELEVIRLVNEERIAYGLNALQIDYVFMTAARFYSQTLADLDLPLGHGEGPYGGSANTVLAFGGTTAGWRNGGGGNWTPEALVSAWMYSESHRNNILGPGHTRVGAGSQLGGMWGVFHYLVLAGGDIQIPN